jgi:outer membrane protein assembly factor BamD
MPHIQTIVLLFLALLLTGCGSLLDQADETKDWSAEKFYAEASAALSDGDYETAIRYYEGLESRYPFGRYATQAQLDVAYAYYKQDEPESAIAAADRFIKLHPRNPYVDYAYYLKGIVNFNRNMGFIQRFVPTDLSQRDPGTTLSSFNDFAELVRRFPESRYAADARKRLVYLRNNLAEYEVNVARYYLKRGAYMASANRCITVIEKYQRTPAVKDALEILIRAYRNMGLEGLSDDAQRVLALNEAKGNLALPASEEEEESVGKEFWDFLDLDRN